MFASWDSRLKEEENAIVNGVAATNIIIENINENFHGANLVADSIPRFLPDAKHLDRQWKHAAQDKAEVIMQTTKLDWEAYWQHLVKLHSQWMTQRFLTTSAEKMVPSLTDVIFDGQLKAEVDRPTQLKPMMAIYDLKDRMEHSWSPCFL